MIEYLLSVRVDGITHDLGVFLSAEEARKAVTDARRRFEKRKDPQSPRPQRMWRIDANIVQTSDGRYRAKLGTISLGAFATREDALQARKEAIQHANEGNLNQYIADVRERSKRLKLSRLLSEDDRITKTKTGKYQTGINLVGKHYHLGTYETREEALTIRREAIEHIRNNDFSDWYSRWKDGYKPPEVVRIVDATKGIRRQNGRFCPFLRNKYMGAFESFDEAVAVRAEGIAHIAAGDFDEWLEERRAGFPTKQKAVFNIKKDGNKYRLFAKIKPNPRYKSLGTYWDREEAEKVKAQAQEHVDAGDYDSWREELMKAIGRPARQKGEGRYPCPTVHIRKNNRFAARVQTGPHSTFSAGTYASREEAEKASQLAVEHVRAGDFDEWFSAVKEKRTRPEKKEEKNPPHSSREKKADPKPRKSRGKAREFQPKTRKFRPTAFIRKQPSGRYIVFMRAKSGERPFSLGTFDSESEAEDVRRQALEHAAVGDFDEWFREHKRKVERSVEEKRMEAPSTGIFKRGERFYPHIKVDQHQYWLGGYSTIEAARNIRKEAIWQNEHGDFEACYARQEFGRRKKPEQGKGKT